MLDWIKTVNNQKISVNDPACPKVNKQSQSYEKSNQLPLCLYNKEHRKDLTQSWCQVQ